MSDALDRMSRLEEVMADIRVSLARIEARSEHAAATEQLEALRGEMSLIRGMITGIPTTWQMIVAIVSGPVALAGLLAAVIFGVAHVLGKV
jgi:hypothetical protein